MLCVCVGGVRRGGEYGDVQGQRLELQSSDRGAVPAGLIQRGRDELGQRRVEERRVARGPRTQSRHLASLVTCVTFSPRRSLQRIPFR